jgi:flagellar biosynthesis chaperone FliJ
MDFLERLQQITAKEPHALSSEEKAFLLARRSYLSKEQKEKFSDILKQKKEVEEVKKPATKK